MKYLLLILMTGCGVTQDLKNVSGSMSTITTEIKGMNKRIDTMTTNTEKMSGNTDDMSGALKSTASSIKTQGTFTALASLLTPDATRYITLTQVNPIGQIIAAKGIAEAANQEDLCGIFFLWLTEINSQVEPGLTKQQKLDIDLSKMYKLSALQTIAGFIPDKILDEMIDKQILKGNQYEEITYNIILLRQLFISTYLLDQGVLASKMTSPSQYESAFTALGQLKKIQDLPFKSVIKLKLSGFTSKDLRQELKLEDIDFKKYYGKLKKKFDLEINPRYNGKRILDIKHKIELGI